MAILKPTTSEANRERLLLRACLLAVYRARLLRSHLLWTVVLGLSGGSLFAQVDEHHVKAFFLSNFTRYVEWPNEKFHSAADPIAICVLGKNPFGGALEEAVRGRSVNGRVVAVQPIMDLAPSRTCHILFVAAAECKRFRTASAALRGSGVLTVGESEEFAQSGGVINFRIEDGKVRFEVNVEAAAQERLRISSKLLSLARIVKK